MARVSDNEYIYISTRIKMLRRGALTADFFARLASAATDDEAVRLLTDKGFDPFEPGDAASLSVSLDKRRDSALKLLYDFAPDRAVIDLFRLKYDYHNAKVCVKNVDMAERLVSYAGTIKPEAIELAVRNGDFKALPENLAEVIKDALAVVGNDPQKADILLDKAMCAEMRRQADASGSTFLKEYVCTLIDCYNLKTIVRAARAGKTGGFISGAFISGGTALPSKFDKAAGTLSGDELQAYLAELLPRLYRGAQLKNAVEAGEKALTQGGALAEFDRECDKALLSRAREGRNVNFGESYVVAYLLDTENELASVRLVMNSRAAGVPAEKIMERLRIDV